MRGTVRQPYNRKKRCKKTPFKLWSCSALREEMHKDALELCVAGRRGACDSPHKTEGTRERRTPQWRSLADAGSAGDQEQCPVMPIICTPDGLHTWWLAHLILCTPDPMHTWSMRTWSYRHLTTCTPDRMHTWCYAHLILCTPDRMHTWSHAHLVVSTPDRMGNMALNHWDFLPQIHNPGLIMRKASDKLQQRETDERPNP